MGVRCARKGARERLRKTRAGYFFWKTEVSLVPLWSSYFAHWANWGKLGFGESARGKWGVMEESGGRESYLIVFELDI